MTAPSRTYHIESHYITERDVAVLVMPDQILVDAFGRAACRETKHKWLAWSWAKGLDTI